MAQFHTQNKPVRHCFSYYFCSFPRIEGNSCRAVLFQTPLKPPNQPRLLTIPYPYYSSIFPSSESTPESSNPASSHARLGRRILSAARRARLPCRGGCVRRARGRLGRWKRSGRGRWQSRVRLAGSRGVPVSDKTAGKPLLLVQYRDLDAWYGFLSCNPFLLLVGGLCGTYSCQGNAQC